MPELEIIVAPNAKTARDLEQEGYEVVNAQYRLSQGEHFDYQASRQISQKMGRIAYWAYAPEQYASRKEDPRFVVSHAMTAAENFAIASLAGIIPHVSSIEDRSFRRKARELTDTLDLIGHDPVARRMNDLPGGANLMAWESSLREISKKERPAAGAQLWQDAFFAPTPEMMERAKKAKKQEAIRQKEASRIVREAERHGRVFGRKVLYVAGVVAPPDLVYGRLDNRGTTADGDSWKYPVVVSTGHSDLTESHVRVGLPHIWLERQLFGSDGLPDLKEATGHKWYRPHGTIATKGAKMPYTQEQGEALAMWLADRIVRQENAES